MYKVLKRLLDITLSIVALAILLPLFIPIILILKFTAEGEVFYFQERIGLNNSRFQIWKFATMLKNSMNIGTGSITLQNDPRVTGIGKFLRKTKINELPQIINILKGDISIVGPRPLVTKTFSAYSEEVQSRIYNVKPGLTGIGSIIFRDEESLISAIKNEDPHDFYKRIIAPYKGKLEMWYQENKSFLLDQRQSGKNKAKERYENYKNQPLKFIFPENFNGIIKTSKKKIKAAVIREKGSNSEREMAYAMDLAGFDVKDVHMTDLVSGRENLEDINFIVAVGGFSNSDVLGSAKGWAGSFLYNEKAKTSLMNFYKRNDTLSLGVCNGCQLFIELGLLHTEHELKPKMNHNDSKKFECIFTSVEIQENNSVMFKNLSGSKLGIWSAHGEGKFNLPYSENKYNIIGKYGYNSYPANPNGSDYNTAIISNKDGRHIAMMPHLERSTFPWNWPYYPSERNDEISPWIIAFENAKNWLSNKI